MMSIVEDLKKLHFTIRGALVIVLFIAPFWYLDIYLFAPEFFKQAPLYIPIVLAFCLTICSAVIYLGLSFAWLIVGSINSEVNLEKSEVPVNLEKSEVPLVALTVFLGVILSSITTFISYKEHWRFMKLVFAMNALVLVLILITSFFLFPALKKRSDARRNEKNKT